MSCIDLPDYTRYVAITVSFPSPTIGNPKKYEGTVATAGVKVTLAVNTDLGRNGGDGYITNDGDGNLKIDISKDGVTFETSITLEVDEVMDLAGLSIHTIKIDATENGTAYRCLVV